MSKILSALNRVQEEARHRSSGPALNIEPPRDSTFTTDLFAEVPSSRGGGENNSDSNGNIYAVNGSHLLRGVPATADSIEHFTVERLEDIIFMGRKKG